MDSANREPLLQVKDLSIDFHTAEGVVHAVNHLSFDLYPGETLGIGPFAEYIFMISVLAVAAPGVPGGVVLASAPIAEAALGITPEHYAVLMAAYMALDGMGTACNLTGDGAIALVVDRFRAGGKEVSLR